MMIRDEESKSKLIELRWAMGRERERWFWTWRCKCGKVAAWRKLSWLRVLI
jgi:hypothetical protein